MPGTAHAVSSEFLTILCDTAIICSNYIALNSLTPRQLEICQFIERFRLEHHMAPTLTEIAKNFGFAGATGVRDHLNALEKKGAIVREHGKARSLRIAEGVLPERSEGIPVLGNIAAGDPIEAIEQCDRFLPVPARLFGKGDLFGLSICGDSMTGEGIRDGDVAIIQKQSEVANGEIAAVVMDEEATLKRVFRDGGALTLRAANPSFPDIVVKNEGRFNVRIAGLFIGLIRSGQLQAAISA